MDIYSIITYVFGSIIFVIVALALFINWRVWKIPLQQVNAIASVVIVIGVLGTFFGIYIGLRNFNTGGY